MKTAIACTALIAAAGGAFAGPVTLDFEGVGRGRNVYIEVGEEYAGTVFAGSIKHRVDGVLLMTYCIDPDQEAQTGVANFERARVWKALDHRETFRDKAAAIAELADNFGASLWTTGASQDDAAAFQIAVWEIIKDFSAGVQSNWYDFTTGEFRASGSASVFTKATQMLSDLTLARNDDLGYIAYKSGEHQDFMGESIPAPAAAALIALAFPVLGRRRRA